MKAPPRTPWSRWAYAAKPGSWPKLLVPAMLGQAMGVSAAGRVGLAAAVGGIAFTVAQLLFIVFWNDFFDRRVDAIKREMFPQGCSEKTIPDGILSAGALWWAGAISGAVALGLGAWMGAQLGRPGAGLGAAGCLAIFVAYSVPPLRMNDRGGGEWLEMLGVGAALPLYQAYLQCGSVPDAALAVIPGLMALSLASATASGLSDERSDRRGGKRTFTTRAGNDAARARVEWLVLLGALAWAAGVRALAPTLPLGFGALAVAIVIINWRRMRRHSTHASTDAFAAHARYKRVLHHAIWRGGACLAFGLLWGVLRG